MTQEQALGLALWLVIFWPIWSPTLNYIRWKNKRRQRLALRILEGRLTNVTPIERVPSRLSRKWEQDEPFPECFEEDDLDV